MSTENAIIAIAENWALENGSEAAGWFLALPASQERSAALENIFFAWASNEPAAALDYLKSASGTGELSPTLTRATLAGWAKSDPQAAVAASLALTGAGGSCRAVVVGLSVVVLVVVLTVSSFSSGCRSNDDRMSARLHRSAGSLLPASGTRDP